MESVERDNKSPSDLKKAPEGSGANDEISDGPRPSLVLKTHESEDIEITESLFIDQKISDKLSKSNRQKSSKVD